MLLSEDEYINRSDISCNRYTRADISSKSLQYIVNDHLKKEVYISSFLYIYLLLLFFFYFTTKTK